MQVDAEFRQRVKERDREQAVLSADIESWLQNFEIFKMKVQNTPKILKYQNTPEILKFIKILRIFKNFQILARRFRAISGVLRRFLRIFPLELEKC